MLTIDSFIRWRYIIQLDQVVIVVNSGNGQVEQARLKKFGPFRHATLRSQERVSLSPESVALRFRDFLDKGRKYIPKTNRQRI